MTGIDNLSYELLSGTSGFSLEIQDSTTFSVQHSKCELCLENGLVEYLIVQVDYINHGKEWLLECNSSLMCVNLLY
ncbi:hypothetical protein GO684_04025 [Wolbachia endosymbiont of Litomosoides brasiliensis]|uniref:hypothetical protein n=1 Tax=Wolbachia endosymbiont of Litomosoides brasiliensis TaxID=1812117 RepID=UPI00158B5FCC|nr:hypothetical protein [Wolbachia endosymbiont of Litomosoides brasiliensis]NUY39794.1 hypothetical protein [Wolbachia endosymbiont of Litomosoides brasiliensis]